MHSRNWYNLPQESQAIWRLATLSSNWREKRSLKDSLTYKVFWALHVQLVRSHRQCWQYLFSAPCPPVTHFISVSDHHTAVKQLLEIFKGIFQLLSSMLCEWTDGVCGIKSWGTIFGLRNTMAIASLKSSFCHTKNPSIDIMDFQKVVH